MVSSNSLFHINRNASSSQNKPKEKGECFLNFIKGRDYNAKFFYLCACQAHLSLCVRALVCSLASI